MTKPIIQPAASTEGTYFAEFADMAADGLFATLLGRKATAILARLFTQPRNDYSYQHSYFIIIDDQIAGMLNGFTEKAKVNNARNTQLLLIKYSTWRWLRLMVIDFFLRNLFSFMERLEPDTFYIQMMGVYPQFRRRGLSKLFLQKVQMLTSEGNCSRLALDVDIHNTVAIAAYLAYGFEIVATSPPIQDEREELAVHRMVKLM